MPELICTNKRIRLWRAGIMIGPVALSSWCHEESTSDCECWHDLVFQYLSPRHCLTRVSEIVNIFIV